MRYLASALAGALLTAALAWTVRDAVAYAPEPAVTYPPPGVVRYLDVTFKDTAKGPRQRFICSPEGK